MSNAQRPSLARKDTRKTKEARQAILDQGVKITLGDDVYEVRLGDVNAITERKLRREYGCSVMGLIEELQDAPGLDSIAALMWLARTIKGDDIDLADIDVSYADLDELEFGDPGAENSPEA